MPCPKFPVSLASRDVAKKGHQRHVDAACLLDCVGWSSTARIWTSSTTTALFWTAKVILQQKHIHRMLVTDGPSIHGPWHCFEDPDRLLSTNERMFEDDNNSNNNNNNSSNNNNNNSSNNNNNNSNSNNNNNNNNHHNHNHNHNKMDRNSKRTQHNQT